MMFLPPHNNLLSIAWRRQQNTNMKYNLSNDWTEQHVYNTALRNNSIDRNHMNLNPRHNIPLAK